MKNKNLILFSVTTFMFSGHVYALNECGTTAPIICSNVAYPSGINYYLSNPGTVQLNNSGMVVSTCRIPDDHMVACETDAGVSDTTLSSPASAYCS